MALGPNIKKIHEYCYDGDRGLHAHEHCWRPEIKSLLSLPVS
jgi:hypothetical protein